MSRWKEYVFSHPDYTVGSGITPDQLFLHRSWTFTIGRELHPATKTLFNFENRLMILNHHLYDIPIYCFCKYL